MTVAKSVRIRWRGLPCSDPLQAFIRANVARLGAFYPGLTAWHVAIEAPDRRQCHAGQVCVSIDVRAPQHQIIANREHEDAGVAMREALDAVARKLEGLAQRDRGIGNVSEKELQAA